VIVLACASGIWLRPCDGGVRRRYHVATLVPHCGWTNDAQFTGATIKMRFVLGALVEAHAGGLVKSAITCVQDVALV